MKRSRGLVASLLTVAVLGAGGCGGGEDQTRPPGPPPPVLGLVDNTVGWGTSMGHEQDLAVRAGARWLREELFWNEVEPERGVRRWGRFDRLFVSAARRGLRVLPLLSDTPDWARPVEGGLPTDTDGYAAYVGDAVRRYGPGGTFWREHPKLDARLAPRWFELWNEPYLVPEPHPGADAERYAKLAAAGMRAGRAANPAARFLVAVDTENSGRTNVTAPWLDGIETSVSGVLRTADGFAVHPYAPNASRSLGALDELQAQLQMRGVHHPLWITEIGWTTCDDGDGCVSEDRQAANLDGLLGALRSRYRRTIRAVFVYRLRDLRPEGEHQSAFGLLRTDASRKPAWAAFRRAADR